MLKKLWIATFSLTFVFTTVEAYTVGARVSTLHSTGSYWSRHRPQSHTAPHIQSKPRVAVLPREDIRYQEYHNTYSNSRFTNLEESQASAVRPRYDTRYTKPYTYVRPDQQYRYVYARNPYAEIPRNDPRYQNARPRTNPNYRYNRPRRLMRFSRPQFRSAYENYTLPREETSSIVINTKHSSRGRLITLENGMQFGIPSRGIDLAGHEVYIYPPRGTYYRNSRPRIDTGYRLRIKGVDYRARRFE